MNNFIIYAIETAICLTLFYLVYWVFLKNETFFKLNRFYLLFSVLISLLVPLLNINMSINAGQDSFLAKHLVLPVEQYEENINHNFYHKYFPKPNRIMIHGNFNDNVNEIQSTIEQAAPLKLQAGSNSLQSINWLKIMLVVYFVGASFFLIRFLANFVWIFSYVLKHQSQYILGMKVIRFEKNSSPFSFLNHIFISQKEYPEADLSKIMAHEKVHIQQKHSIDLILVELLLVFQWFNPFVWFYKRAIKINHEYLADNGTLDSGIDLPSYQYSLLNQVLHENNFEMVSSYNFSIKKRIKMMMKKRSPKLATLKLAIALPIISFLFLAFAFKINISKKQIANSQGNPFILNEDTTIKKVNVSIEYLKSLQGEYLSTNEPGRTRRIIFTELLGTLFGHDNGYTYKVIPVGDGKFINPDDHATLEFNSKDNKAISLLLFGKINLNKVDYIAKIDLNKVDGTKGKDVRNKSVAFTLANRMLKDGIESALKYYKTVKDSNNYFLTEIDMSYAGFQLLDNSKVKEAVALLKLDTELFPNLYNSYDSYGEALLMLGDKTQAIESFKKSVKLNPGSKNGLKRLKELGVNTDEFLKPVKIPVDELKLLEGDYLSTNERNGMRWIKFMVDEGVLIGNDNGYRYKLIPMGNGKFINPDDGESLVFDTKNKNEITMLLFGTINLRKVKKPVLPPINLKNYSGLYIPAKKDTILKPMEIINSMNKLFRFIETPNEPANTPNRNVELECVTDNIFFYPDNSGRSIEFTFDDNKEVNGCILRRWDGNYTLSKKK